MSSNLYSIPHVVEAISNLNPKEIIDIGAGSGKYGLLLTEYLKDLYYIDAVEPEHKLLVSDDIYLRFYPTKIQDFKFEQDYDVALLIAVVCRFSKGECEEILKNIKKHCVHIVLTIEKEQHGGMTQYKPEDFPNCKVIDLPYEYLIIC